MAAVDIPFPTVSSPGERPNINGGRLINAIVEEVEGGSINRKRAPGLTRLVTSAGDNKHCRGMIDADSGTMLVVYDGKVEAVTSSGATSTVLGNLPGSDIVTLARNNAALPDIVCVSPGNGVFTLSAGGAPLSYPDADVESPVSVCFGDGYFFFTYGDGRCKSTGINSTSINTLDVVKAESSSSGLRRGVFFRGQLFLMGPDTIEAWQNTANPTGFPFSRAAVIPRGIASTNAVAGWEGNFTQSLIWVGSDNIVYTLDGYTPVRISNHDIENQIQAISDKSELQAFVFMNSGHPFWVLKSSKWCWVRDLLTSTWQERKSYLSDTWRASQSHYMWGDWLLGDEVTGYVFRPDKLNYAEDTQPLVWSVASSPAEQFPTRFSVPRADFEFIPGTGNAAGDAYTDFDPSVVVEWSDDGGASWSVPVVRKLGQVGKYATRISVNRTGRTSVYGRQWRLSVSDPVYVGLLGGKMFSAYEAQY